MADDADVPVSIAAPEPAWKKNLKPIKPGEVRNPNGRSGIKWQQQFREFFDASSGEEDDEGLTISRFRKVLLSLYAKAMRGSDPAQKLIVEQMVGKAKESIDLSNVDGSLGPKTLRVQWVDPPKPDGSGSGSTGG